MAKLTGYYYIKVEDTIRCEHADGPIEACRKAFGVVYNKPIDTAEYKFVGTRRPGSLSATKQVELLSGGWKLLRTGQPTGKQTATEVRGMSVEEHPDDREARHCEEDERRPESGPTFVVASLRRVDGAFRELLYLVAAYRDQPAGWTADPTAASRFVGKENYLRAAQYVRDCEKFGLLCFIHCEHFE